MTKTIGISDDVHQMLIDKQKEIYDETKINFKLADLTDLILRHSIRTFAIERVSVRDQK
jgi:hypothetical protein